MAFMPCSTILIGNVACPIPPATQRPKLITTDAVAVEAHIALLTAQVPAACDRASLNAPDVAGAMQRPPAIHEHVRPNDASGANRVAHTAGDTLPAEDAVPAGERLHIPAREQHSAEPLDDPSTPHCAEDDCRGFIDSALVSDLSLFGGLSAD